MSQPTIQLAFKGLYTSVNDLTATPGALEIADNIVIENENLAQPRRGFDDYGATIGTTPDRASTIWFYQGYTFTNFGSKVAYSAGEGQAFTEYSGTYSAPTDFKTTFAESNKNLYFTTAAGVFKIDSVVLEPKAVGTPKAVHSTQSVTGATGFLANNYGVNYKFCWGYKDQNGNLILGAPSELVTYKNTAGGSRNVISRVYIPAGISTTHFVQIYRSYAQDMSGAALPSTELYQSGEVNPSALNISNGYLDFTDISPDALLGQALYTNQSIGGVSIANNQPPLAKCIAEFKKYLVYGNTTSKHRYFLRLLGTGSATTSLQGGDTIVIGGRTYTGGAATNTATRTFAVYGGTSGAATTGSASEDVRKTALDIIRCINEDSLQTTYGFYLNDTSSVSQGEMLLEERAIGGSAFTLTVSRSGCWSPSELGLVAVSSKNEASLNRIYYSKVQQPEAVPLLQYIDVGATDKQILALIPLRESLIILKEDGIYRLSANLGVDLIDGTQQLIGQKTAVALNNAVFALTTQGVVNITDSGAQVIDLPISNDIRQLFGSALDTIKSNSFAVAYETSRMYILFLPATAGESYCSQAFVFNTFTQTWVRWTLNKSAGALDPATDKLVLGSAVRNGLDLERKQYSYSDHVDYDSVQTISAQVANVISIGSSDTISVGDMIYESESIFSFVESVDSAAGTVTVLDDVTFTLGPVSVYSAIPTKIKWLPITAGAPYALKHFSEASFYFQALFPSAATATFTSDKSAGEKPVPLTGDSASGGWGLFAWGDAPWGNVPSKKPVRLLVPREHQRCSQLSLTFEHSYAYGLWELSGVSLLFNPGSSRI